MEQGDDLRFIELVVNYGELPSEVLEAIDPKIQKAVSNIKSMVFDRALKNASDNEKLRLAGIFPDGTKPGNAREL